MTSKFRRMWLSLNISNLSLSYFIQCLFSQAVSRAPFDAIVFLVSLFVPRGNEPHTHTFSFFHFYTSQQWIYRCECAKSAFLFEIWTMNEYRMKYVQFAFFLSSLLVALIYRVYTYFLVSLMDKCFVHALYDGGNRLLSESLCEHAQQNNSEQTNKKKTPRMMLM